MVVRFHFELQVLQPFPQCGSHTPSFHYNPQKSLVNDGNSGGRNVNLAGSSVIKPSKHECHIKQDSRRGRRRVTGMRSEPKVETGAAQQLPLTSAPDMFGFSSFHSATFWWVAMALCSERGSAAQNLFCLCQRPLWRYCWASQYGTQMHAVCAHKLTFTDLMRFACTFISPSLSFLCLFCSIFVFQFILFDPTRFWSIGFDKKKTPKKHSSIMSSLIDMVYICFVCFFNSLIQRFRLVLLDLTQKEQYKNTHPEVLKNWHHPNSVNPKWTEWAGQMTVTYIGSVTSYFSVA